MVECLRKVDAAELVDSGDKFKVVSFIFWISILYKNEFSSQVWSIEPITVYIPTIEKKTANNPNPFVVDYPLNIIKERKFHPVPLMMGCMANEGILRVARK